MSLCQKPARPTRRNHYLKSSIDGIIEHSEFSEAEFLNHLIKKQAVVKKMDIELTDSKVFLDFLLRGHLGSCMPIIPFPEPFFAHIPGEIIFHGGLDKFIINPAGVKVSVKA